MYATANRRYFRADRGHIFFPLCGAGESPNGMAGGRFVDTGDAAHPF